jgi:S-adenosylmethionine-diacylglycerol 3-amino-3-carboxypropyl transferase
VSQDYDPPLLYARLWEDHDVLRAGLRIQPGERALSIAAAGDNSFALLLDDPAKVVMLDRNRTQLGLCHLKIACLRHLEPAQSRAFLGIEAEDGRRRLETYRFLRPHLPDIARETFDQADSNLAEGVLNTGKFERYLALFRDRVLPLVQWPSTVAEMTSLADPAAQKMLYDSRWDSWRWRTLFRLFFSRFVMQRRGRDSAFFEHVQGSVAEVFRGRAAKALCDIPVASNPYLMWILTGKSLHSPYLSDTHYATIRDRLDRVELVEDDLFGHLADGPADRYDAYNLSDCFEYMSQGDTDRLLGHIVDAARPGARLVYWNLLVPRAGANEPRLVPERALADELHAMDRAFFYGRLHVERTPL